MADAVTARVLTDDARTCVVHLTGISDGTGEAAVLKVDKSALQAAVGGAEAAALDIEAARWNVQGFSSVRVLWDHTVDDVALVMCGSGYDDFLGPEDRRGFARAPLLADPRSAGGPGDLLVTSAGAAAGATYDVTLWLRKAVT